MRFVETIGINTDYKKCLSNLLTEYRHANTVYNGSTSTRRRFPNRVSQGLVLSQTIFNVFMHDIPIPAHPDTHILFYADNVTLFSQHPDPRSAATQLQDYINILEHWLHSNRMKISLSKSTLILIPNITIGKRIQLTTHNNTQQHRHTLHQHGHHTRSDQRQKHVVHLTRCRHRY